MPTPGSPISILFNGLVSAYSARSSSRCSTNGCLTMAFCGIMVYLVQFLVILVRGCSSGRSPSSTMLLECEVRVVVRKSTGVSKRSLSS